DWQHFSVSLTAPANADGFRFEVRVYHEDNNTGGLVYYDDFSIMAAGISPEPSNYPTGFDALAMGISINLAWTDAIGDQLPAGYLVLASDEDNIIAPVDGTPVADDIDLSDGSGALNIVYGVEQCTFSDLEPNAPYYFKIYPYTNGGGDIDYKNDGTAPGATATTADVTIIESENFNSGWGTWDRISVIGDQIWEIDEDHGMGDTPCAKCTGYEGQAYENEDWLISPPMNFDNYTNEVINFYNADAYTGPALEALISNDYDGVDPTTATWETLTFETSTGYFEWISSGDIDISEINGEEVYIAFKFTSTNAESATWEVDDILITGTGGTGLGEQNNFPAQLNIYPNPAVNTVNITTDADLSLNLQVYSLLGTKVMEELSFTGSTNIDLAGIRNGIYLLHFTDQNGNTGIEKLVIEK
ncbi:MAG: choice-of-anchor J domain-containing protein, partial [Bacteroidales bacterium]|nr:choice-of-anchor J domain-containing protein [Bacteroidales bacterium]